MRSILKRSLTSALFAALILAAASMAQPPVQKKALQKRTAKAPPISVEDIIERIMAFDKNKDGKVTSAELPERMHHLIELGDTNKDGALDADEIRKLATRLAATPGEFGGGPLVVGPGPGAPKGFGVGGAVRGGFGPGFGPPGPDPVEGVVDDLKLSGKKKEQAMAAAKAHQENVRKLVDQARAELLEKMKTILSDEEFADFTAALDRPRGVTFFKAGPKGGGRKKLDPPQK